mgnify:CR=1 FL=1
MTRTSKENNNIILKVHNITKIFPGVVALNRVSIDLRAGEIHGLLGQNGAGKTTLLKILYGALKPDEGKIYVYNKEVNFNSPTDARKHGIVLVSQELIVVPHLTVMENIALLGFKWNEKSFSRFNYSEVKDRVEKIFHMLDVSIDPEAKVKDIRAAEKMLVQIAAALSVDAKIILLDEATSPLSPEDVKKLFNILEQLKEKGIGIIFVTHRVKEALSICDRITVLRNGLKIKTFEKDKGEISEYDIIEAILGIDPKEFYYVKDVHETKVSRTKEEILRIENLSTIPKSPVEVPLANINLNIYKGEITAIFGLMGSGKTELGKTLIGLTKIKSGKILIMGREVKIKSPNHAKSLGIFYIPEDRRNEGLIHNLTVSQNITISSLEQFSKGIFIDNTKEITAVKTIVNKLNIITPSLNALITKLSGGNQQKSLVGRALLSKPKIIILDEPTVGLDIYAKREIRKLTRDMVISEDITVLWLTSDPDEALGIADRIAVMKDGKIKAILERADIDRETLVKYAL